MKKGKRQPQTVKNKEEKLCRRKFLMTAAAMAGAVAANALPGEADATNGDSIKIGQQNNGISSTKLEIKFSDSPALKLVNSNYLWSGQALSVEGKVSFSTAGRGTIAKGATYGSVYELQTNSSQILVTLQRSAGPGVYLSHVSRISSDLFRVVLNKAAAIDTPFAYFVID